MVCLLTIRGRRRRTGGADGSAPSERKGLLARGCYGSGDLVEGRVGNLIRFDPRSSLDDRGQELRDLWIGSTVVGFRILRPVPQTDGEGIGAGGGDEVDLVLKPLLLSKHGNDLLLEPPRELSSAIGLQMHRDFACKHWDLLGCRGQGTLQITMLT